VTLPAGTISPGFCLRLTEDDKTALLLEDAHDPMIGVGVLCLVLLLPGEGFLQANLDAPIVINLHNLRCVQSVMEPLNGYFRLHEDGQWRRIC
jgi:flagellar assembly factor FliW